MNLIVSAPSGSGKTTILKRIFEKYPNKFGFSVSATTRKPRVGEANGVDYYFLSEKEFKDKIEANAFLEYEQVYQGLSYGTLKSEVERINDLGRIAVFDVDVKGGVNIKKQLGKQAYSIFIMPPSIETLKQRLLNRGTETEQSLNKRLQRASMEIEYSKQFDEIVVNDDLEMAIEQFDNALKNHIFRIENK